jgi:Mrp family chromosome partitioning ATPase
VIERPTEPLFNDGWEGESDATWGDRPGIVASLLRYRAIVVAATLLGALLCYGIAELGPVRYEAHAALIISDPGAPSVLGGGDALESGDRQVYLDKQADIATSTVVLERALEILGSGQSLDDVRDELDAQPSANLASISIAATGSDPRSAAELANAVGTAYEQVTEERVAADAARAIANLETLRTRYQADLDASPRSADGQLTFRQQQLADQIADLLQREQDITTQAEVYGSGVEYFEQAEPPTSPSQPKPKLAAALGGLLGLLAAGAWAWWAAARDRRAEGRGEPARILEAPLLGEVQRLGVPQEATGQRATPSALAPALDDAYHFIVASMEYELAGVGGKSIAVTSVGPGDSKTSTALQIGNAATQENRKILLIDADVRVRHLSERVGLGQVAAERNGDKLPVRRSEGVGAKEYIDRLVSTDSGMVLPVASNPTEPGQPTGSDRALDVDVGHAVRSIGEMFDLVLIDAPALLASSDALGVAGQADGVLLVVSHQVALSELRDVRDRLAFVRTPLIGYVYVRPPGLGVRTPWGRVRRRPGGAAWIHKDATGNVEPGERTDSAAGSPDLDHPIEDLGLSERPANCLKRAQIDTIGELMMKTEEDLLSMTSFGQKSLDEVKAKLDERGLSLRA